MSKHSDFIKTPIINILEEAINIAEKVSIGIEMHPLYDYVLQTTFLKMTGSQEQKLKCIQWELATDDYEYRYDILSKSIGELSKYKDKNELYVKLRNLVNKYKRNEFDKKNILNNIFTFSLSNVFRESNLFSGIHRSFEQYSNIWSNFEEKDFMCEKHLLSPDSKKRIKSLKDIYDDHLYKHRNRIAHNTVSYQQNLPSLKSLIDENYKYNNYFLWFSILILIDNIFIELYNKYREQYSDF